MFVFPAQAGIQHGIGFLLDPRFHGDDNIGLLLKLAIDEEFVGDAERKTGVYLNVHEDLSTESTHKLPSIVEFGKKSIIKKAL